MSVRETIAAEIEKFLGKPPKLKVRSRERAAVAAPMVKAVLTRGRDGVTPFPAARTRAVLLAVKPRQRREVKGAR